MPASYEEYKVLENNQINKSMFVLSVKGDFDIFPGQFFMLRAWGKEPLLMRPLSVYDYKDGILSFMYEVKGDGTKLLSGLKENDKISLLGPLGTGFKTDKFKGKIALIAGGMGIAPLVYAARCLEGCEVDLYAGFSDSPFGLEGKEDLFSEKHIMIKGYITDMFSPLDYNAVLTCGPEVMMKKVMKICSCYSTPVYASFEKNMGCGIGACLVCSMKTKLGMKRVCKDGPVFSGREVILNV